MAQASVPDKRERLASDSSHSTTDVYHETQSRWRCGLHAVNAVLKKRAYTPADFDRIADSMVVEKRKPWFHPHRSPFGMGDYDANVLLVALEKAKLSTTWVGEKDDIRGLLENDALWGFLLNVESKHWLQKVIDMFIEENRHWVAIARYSEDFYLVDSKAPEPVRFASTEDLLTYFDTVRAELGHILSVEEAFDGPSAR